MKSQNFGSALRSSCTPLGVGILASSSLEELATVRHHTDETGLWYADGDTVRKAYTLPTEDDDFGQAGTLVRHVLDDAARARLVSNIVGHLKDGLSAPVLARALDYWRKVDRDLGGRIAAEMKDR
jgi:catalase